MSRWRPGKGWIRTADYGNWVAWMRPSPDGCGVEITVYTGDGFGHYYDLANNRATSAEVWRVWCPPGSTLPYTVADKMHRIRWAVDYANLETVLERYKLPPSHRGHRRLNYNRQVFKWPLPRKILRALED